jgi:hypothetical protein
VRCHGRAAGAETIAAATANFLYGGRLLRLSA